MKVKRIVVVCLAGALSLGMGLGVQASDTAGVIEPGEYPMFAVAHHTPEVFVDAQSYWDSLQRVELRVGGTEDFINLPELGMKQPYTGYLSLGEADQRFAVIVDVFGDEKRLYLDTNGDRDFAGEPMTLLLNEWRGLQLYWVTGPEPLEVQVAVQVDQVRRPLAIAIASGFLNQSGIFVKEQPFLLVRVKTWFLSYLYEEGYQKAVAVVDLNHNGRYNDPEDGLFVDYDNNLYFSSSESVTREQGTVIETINSTLTVDWEAYPQWLQVGGKE